MPTDLPDAKIAFIAIPSDDPEKLSFFYEDLFDTTLSPSLFGEPSFHAPISSDGIDIIITKRRNPKEQPTVYFAISDLQEELDELKANGGQVVWGPESIDLPKSAEADNYKNFVKQTRPGINVSDSMGKAALVIDPSGNSIGLIQLEEQTAAHYRYGIHRQRLAPDQLRDQAFASKNGLAFAKAKGLLKNPQRTRVPKAARRHKSTP
jgi:predicted enzyme related to lactoylglutathione lyase